MAYGVSYECQEEEVINTFQPADLKAGGVKPANLVSNYPEIGIFS